MLQTDQLKSPPTDDLEGMLRLGVTAVTAPLVSTSSVASPVSEGAHVLIVDDGSAIATALIQHLRSHGLHPILLQEFAQARPAPTIVCDWQDPVQVEQQLNRLREVTGGLAGILFLSTSAIPLDDHWFTRARRQLQTAIAVVRGAHLQHPEPLQFVYFITAQGGKFGLDSNQANALAPGLEAIAHPLSLEMTKTVFRSIDLDAASPPEVLAQQIWDELAQPPQPYRTAFGWQQGERVALSVEEIHLPRSVENLSLNRASVVLFAGGARGIGAVCAKALAQQAACKIIFLGRTPLTEEAWALSRLSESERKQQADLFTKNFKAAHPGCPPRAPREAWKKKLQALEAIETLNTIQSYGAEAEYYAVDVRDRSAVLQTFQQIHQRFGRIDVAVHVAGLGGVETDRMLLRKDWDTIHQVLETKVIGALHILKACEAVGVKLFLGFGSIASRFGNTGQVDYAAANGLLTGIARAHNATTKLPVARVLAWGAWDGVGMAVSGPTKDMLTAYGLKFIPPDLGANCFIQELTPRLGSSTPAELYLSPKWAALTDLLAQQKEQQRQKIAPSTKTTLLGSVREHQQYEYLKAEHQLNAHAIAFLDHHRYDGTAWVPGVMGIEVCVEAAALLFPHFSPYAVQNLHFKKAIRLVRDEPVDLLTEVRTNQVLEGTARVQAIVSARFKERTWVFAEMDVLLSDPLYVPAPTEAKPLVPPGTSPPGTITTPPIHYTRKDLYPSEWLRFHAKGETFQVLDTLRLDCSLGHAEGEMTTTTDLRPYYIPLTLIDGCLQAYSCLVSDTLKAWSGPPLNIGEIRWTPDAIALQSAIFKIDAQPQNFTSSTAQIYSKEGRCGLTIHQLEFGGTGLSAKPQSSSPPVPLTPYLGKILTLDPGQQVQAEQILDPATEVLLRDHKFSLLNNLFVFVPAVYFLEAAVEAAFYLNPQLPPVEVQDFHVHRAFHFINEPQILITEAKVVAPGKTHVRMSSKRGEKMTLHSEAYVIQGAYSDLNFTPHPPRMNSETRGKADLYPRRIPNGFVFQVVEEMELGEGHVSRSLFQTTELPKEGNILPITLLDGAFQVDSVTRSGFDRQSGLPRSVSRLRWLPQIARTTQVQCFSFTGSSATDSPGEILLVGPDQTVLLEMSGIILTPVVPSPSGRGRR